MAIDPVNRRLFVGCRKPQKLIVMSADDGKVLADLPIGAGVDATQFDGDIFASCRDGTLAVARETSPGKFAIVADGGDKAGRQDDGPRSDDAHALSSHGGVGGREPWEVAARHEARFVHDPGGAGGGQVAGIFMAAIRRRESGLHRLAATTRSQVRKGTGHVHVWHVADSLNVTVRTTDTSYDPGHSRRAWTICSWLLPIGR